MAKLVHNDVLDAALEYIQANVNLMTVCDTSQPATRGAAASDDMLASAVYASSDFTIAEGDSDGRKVTVFSRSGLTITNTGTAEYICLCNDTDLLYATAVNSQALDSDNTLDVPAWDIEIGDPT